MALWNKSELLQALKDELLEENLPDNLEIDEVLINGRQEAKNGLFVALKGENHDAHDFLDQASKNGCSTFIVHDKKSLVKVSNTNFVLVKDTFKALNKLAEFSRKRSQAKIIGLTGSVGKTSTKEMLKLVFESQGKTFATFGNLNNHIGVPLSLSNFARDCDFGIFEMGMNHAGEIEVLSKLVHPHLALITTVGKAHIEFFENEEEIAKAKSEIFIGLEPNGIVLINKDNKHYEFLKNRAKELNIKESNISDFGKDLDANYQIIRSGINSINSSVIEAKLKDGKEFYYEIATSNSTTISNSISTIACLDLVGNDFASGIETLKNIKTPTGRGNVSKVEIDAKLINLIDDSYNASVLSIKSGIENLMNLKKIADNQKIIVALGDMLELGTKSEELHQEVIDFINEKSADFLPDFLILVGEKFEKVAKNLVNISYKTFKTSNEAAKEISNFISDGDSLYIKGSRGIKMENLVK